MSTFATHLRLQRTASGWALIDDLGRIVFQAEGRDARQRCLGYATDLGVLHLSFDEQRRRGPSRDARSFFRRRP
jgi:hypothetical protein